MLIAGVDEAGRGPLAGPVCAAAVILDVARPIPGITDSKKLSPERRSSLDLAIRAQALAWSIGWASVEEIDRINILQASLLAMQRAVAGLDLIPGHVLVDGNQCPILAFSVEAIVGGDASVPEIGAASILAKVARDRRMEELDREYPGYGFARHKGYPTRLHLDALTRLGVTPHHRRSFGPVRRILDVSTRP
ncbi:ribonuclease HII [Thiocystis violacea]|uniref:ribonuclease HII n=1 Tax=Thiocystis violacea TaxID=13725 RepID=UPI0019032562|nr:ribonuclease HII [Thiocystis violacea]MBK1720935.1 ribonuclease HII [Thiocystis violacea]